MEINFKIINLIASITLTGLTAGLCFTWSNAVTPGIGMLDDISFLKAFQAMNRAIINKTFLLVFLGPVIFLIINTYLFRNNTEVYYYFLAATALYFIGIGLVTVFGNVPLNEILDQHQLETMSSDQLKELRNQFESPWNQWHRIRSLSSLSAFVLMLIGLYIIK